MGEPSHEFALKRNRVAMNMIGEIILRTLLGMFGDLCLVAV